MSVARLLIAIVILLQFSTASAQQSDEQGRRCCGYFLSGYVWEDLNENGVNDSEPPLAGWTVEVYSVSGGGVAATAVTDATGYYEFMTPVWCGGEIIVSLVLQPGWSLTYPTAPGVHQLVGTGCGSTINADFGAIGGLCDDHTQTWTLDAEFQAEDVNGLDTSADELALSPTPTTLGYAWVANYDGTVSRIDTSTGNEIARYYTGPPDVSGSHNYLSPSRTAVDADGNCWVLNRNFSGEASVTQILASGGVDRNSNLTIETSSDNVTIDGQIDVTEILPWGDDERVARHYKVGGVFPDNLGRALTIDKTGMLWVGLYNAQRVIQLDPSLSTVTYAPDFTPAAPPELQSISTAPYSPYGLALSPNGLLYGSSLSQFAFEIDPGVASGGTVAGPAMTQYIEHTAGTNYGIAVDQDCVVWLAMVSYPGGVDFGCARWDPSVSPTDPALGWSYSNIGAEGQGRGITVDFNGNVWMATNDFTGTINAVAKYAPTDPPTFLGSYPTTSSTPVGVGIESSGNLVVVGQSAPDWVLLDTTTGSQIPLGGPQTAGPYPYTYSDFTGSMQALVNEQQGVWTAISDAGATGMIWTEVNWTETTPPGTTVEVEARVAATLGALSAASWITIPTSGPLGSTMVGQYMEVRVTLTRNADCGTAWVTPTVPDVNVVAICDDCALGPCGPVFAECTGPAGAIVDYTPPVLPAGPCNAGNPVVTTPPPGSLFPIGVTTVTATTITAFGDTLTCSFPVVVSAECGGIPEGGCCFDDVCDKMTEAECDAAGGIYTGDGTNCNGGCNYSCQRPPRNMTAWFPLDGDTAGVTPNIAEPTASGVLSGAPTPVPGEWVTASYHFTGASGTNEIRATDHPSLDVNSSDMSIDVWVRTTTVSGFNPIADKRQLSPFQGYYLYLVDGYPAIQFAVGGSSVAYVLNAGDGPAAFVADGNWHMIAVTIDRNDAAGVKFYVDGVQVGPSSDPTTVLGNSNSNADLVIGRSHTLFSSASWFDGDIDEVEIFRRVLTPNEIFALHGAGQVGKCREGCSLPDRIVACNTNTVTTSVTICNYDDSPHLYSWGLAPSGVGCDTPVSSFSPSYGTIEVPANDCVTIPVTVQIPSGLPHGGTSCMQVTIYNHDTGRVFGCTGTIQKNKWFCIKWETPVAKPLMGIVHVNPTIPFVTNVVVAHIGPAQPGLKMPYELRPVTYEDESVSAGNVSLNGLPNGRTLVGSVDIPVTGEVRVPITIDLLEHLKLDFDKLQLWADDDMDGNLDPIGELVVRSTLNTPTAVEEPEIPKPTRAFRVVPNPFNPNTSIVFELGGKGKQPVDLRIFDMRGRKVKEFYSMEMLDPGIHTVPWDGTDRRGVKIASGVYLIRLSTPQGTETVKSMLVK